MLAQNPDVQKVGLLYSLSEPNSTTPIAEAKAYLDAKEYCLRRGRLRTPTMRLSPRPAFWHRKVWMRYSLPPTTSSWQLKLAIDADLRGGRYPPLHRRRFLCTQWRIHDLRCKLYRSGNEDRGSCFRSDDEGHGRYGRFLQDGWRHHHGKY